jgi:ribose transport system permease protein
MATNVARLKRAGLPRVNLKAALVSGPVMSAVVLIVLLMVWSYYQPGGLTIVEANDFSTLMTTLALAGFGTTLIVITGGFDLSVAGVISVTNAFVATRMGEDNIASVVLQVLAIGLAVGLVNGFAVAILGLESLAATLATYIMLAGFALIVLDVPGGTVPAAFSDPLTTDTGGIPAALFVLLSLAAFWLLLKRTSFGTGLFALGENEDAARMSGVPTRAVKMGAYALAGVMYGLAGLYLSAVTVTGDPNAGTPFLLAAFAAVALGGASLAGGRGSAIGTILGAGVLTVIPKMLFVLGASDFWAGLVQGLVIIAAVLFGLLTIRAAEARKRRARLASRNQEVPV